MIFCIECLDLVSYGGNLIAERSSENKRRNQLFFSAVSLTILLSIAIAICYEAISRITTQGIDDTLGPDAFKMVVIFTALNILVDVLSNT